MTTRPPRTRTGSSGWDSRPSPGRLDRIQLVPTRANGQPALAAYADEHGEGVYGAYGVMVFAIQGNRIDGITGFARQPALFTRLGLPTQLAARPSGDG